MCTEITRTIHAMQSAVLFRIRCVFRRTVGRQPTAWSSPTIQQHLRTKHTYQSRALCSESGGYSEYWNWDVESRMQPKINTSSRTSKAMHEVHCTVQESPLQVITIFIVSGAFEGPSGAVGSLDLLPILQAAPVQAPNTTLAILVVLLQHIF